MFSLHMILDILSGYLFLMLIIPGSIHVDVRISYSYSLTTSFCSLFWKEMNMGEEASY